MNNDLINLKGKVWIIEMIKKKVRKLFLEIG